MMSAKSIARELNRLTASWHRWWRGSYGVVNPFARMRVLRPAAVVTLLACLSMVASPTALAMRHAAVNSADRRLDVMSALERYNADLAALRHDVGRGDLRGIGQRRDALHQRAHAVQEELVQGRWSADDTKARNDHERFFTSRHAQLMERIDVALNGTSEDQRQALRSVLDATGAAPKRLAKDFAKLPWRVEKPTERAPVTDASALSTWLAAQGAPSGPRSTPKAVEIAEAKAAPGPGDLAPNVDAQITQPIRDLAASLHNNPVAIYHWVRNNVEFFPSYGSAQGSQVTLDKRRGNGFDTASLLVALYRAAGIPARYVYGTVQVPADQAMNWVGGAQTPNAAMQILGQGGVPVTGLVSGGQIGAITLEHVWVEAFVDYAPGRGAINRTPRTWVPMDPSFKQYRFTAAMDIKSQVPLDPAAFAATAGQGSTQNPQENWVQGLNVANLQNAVTTYRGQLQSFVASTNSNATVRDIIGRRDIITRDDPILLGSLPYKVRAIAGRVSTLPAGLRHRFFYTLYADADARSFDEPTWTYQADLPAIAGKKVVLGFVPASPTDQNALVALVPKPHANGSPIQESELPTTLPHSIRVKAQLRVDGQVVVEGGVFGIGDELAGRGGFTNLDFSGTDLTDDDSIIAGQQSALGISVFGISSAQMNALSARLQATEAGMRAGTPGAATAESFTGDILTATMWSYFAMLQNDERVASSQANMLDYPALSYGFFHASGQPIQLFGIVTTGLRMVGVLMDVGHLRRIGWEKHDDTAAWIRYNRLRGQYASAMESSIPEKFFNDPATCNADRLPNSPLPDCPRGISTASGLALAQSQGQRIYTITQANAAVALPAVQASSDVIAEIQDAISAGKEVAVHSRPLVTPKWTGTVYSVIDPQTGAGAYLVNGGANGGVIDFFGEHSTAIGFGLFIAGLIAAAIGGIAPLIVLIVALVATAFIFEAAYLEALENAQCEEAIPCIKNILLLMVVVAVIMTVAGFWAYPALGLALGLFGLILADDLAKAAARGCNIACQNPNPPPGP